MHLRIAMFAPAALLVTIPAAAQSPPFLPADDAIKAIMDGRPWNGVSAENRHELDGKSS